MRELTALLLPALCLSLGSTAAKSKSLGLKSDMQVATAGASIAPMLVGTWRLTRYADIPEGGEPVYAFGQHPAGGFIFTADGHASFHMMRNPPDPNAPVTDVDPDACLPAWYCSYYGTYRVDPDGGGWTVHVLAANIPGFIGIDQHRRFRIVNDRLVISETYRGADGRMIHAERVLARERQARRE